jgi:L-asparagine transporter-like permease
MVIWSTLERAVFGQSEYAMRTIPATTIIAFLVWAALALALQRPGVRKFFQEYPA